MSSEVRWMENDLKVELLGLEVKKLRKSYLERNTNATNQEVNQFINKKLRKHSDSLLTEQFSIISDSELIKNRKV